MYSVHKNVARTTGAAPTQMQQVATKIDGVSFRRKQTVAYFAAQTHYDKGFAIDMSFWRNGHGNIPFL